MTMRHDTKLLFTFFDRFLTIGSGEIVAQQKGFQVRAAQTDDIFLEGLTQAVL